MLAGSALLNHFILSNNASFIHQRVSIIIDNAMNKGDSVEVVWCSCGSVWPDYIYHEYD